MLLRQLLKIAAVLFAPEDLKPRFSLQEYAVLLPFRYYYASRRKDWPSLYHSLGRRHILSPLQDCDVPPDLMNRDKRHF